MISVSILAPAVLATLLSWHSGTWPALGSIAACFLSAIVWAIRGGTGICWRRVAPLTILTGTALVQIAAGSGASRYDTLKAAMAWGGWTALFLAGLSAFRSTADRGRLLNLFGGLAGVLAVISLLMPSAGRLGIPGISSMAPDYMVGPFPNRNIYACFAELSLPVTVWLAVRTKNYVWWIASTALVASVLAAGTRAGAAVILTECLILSVLAGKRWVAIVLASTALITVIASGETLATRLSYRKPFEFRADLAQASLRMANERPLLGWGLGSYAAAYPQFATFDVGRRVNHAHNDWLEWVAEAGIPAGALIAGFFIYSLRGVHLHWWALGLGAVCLHALVDYPMQRQGVALWMILFAAALIAARETEPPKRPLPIRPAPHQ